jgi:hypothetical protein
MNGVLKTSQYWNDGRKKRMNYYYSDIGVLIEKGRYSKDKKQGPWINFISKDTVTYKNGEKVLLSEEDIARDVKRKESKAKKEMKREEKKKENN